MATQNLLGIVGRIIIIDDVPLDEFVIMREKERQHLRSSSSAHTDLSSLVFVETVV